MDVGHDVITDPGEVDYFAPTYDRDLEYRVADILFLIPCIPQPKRPQENLSISHSYWRRLQCRAGRNQFKISRK